eukprot:g16595.t1
MYHHREKLQDCAWEGPLVGCSNNSRACRIYNPATLRVVESRNVTFIETPDAPVPPAAANTRDSSFTPDADSRGDACFGDDSDTISVDSGDDGDIESDADADVNESPQTESTGVMEKGLQSLKDHEVADLITVDTLPPGASPIGSRWVFKMKPRGTFKARLVAQGYRQRHGIDCGETFTPVCRISSQRTLLCIAISKGLYVEHLDVNTAFLNAPVDEDVWVYQAPGFEDNHPETGKQQPPQSNPDGAVYLDKSGT